MWERMNTIILPEHIFLVKERCQLVLLSSDIYPCLLLWNVNLGNCSDWFFALLYIQLFFSLEKQLPHLQDGQIFRKKFFSVFSLPKFTGKKLLLKFTCSLPYVSLVSICWFPCGWGGCIYTSWCTGEQWHQHWVLDDLCLHSLAPEELSVWGEQLLQSVPEVNEYKSLVFISCGH